MKSDTYFLNVALRADNKPFQVCKHAGSEVEPLKCKTGFIKLTHEYMLCLGVLYKFCTRENQKYTPHVIYIMCFF